MKKMTAFIFNVVLVATMFAQTGTKELYSLFPALPNAMSNADLEKVITPDKRLDDQYVSSLSTAIIPGGEQEVYVIGKVETGKIVHLVYGVVSYADRATNDYFMNIACSTFDTKNGEMVRAGLQNYLALVGRDALKRESSFSVADGVITFVLKSTDESNNVEVETTKYKFGKFLEFISRN